MGRVDREHLSLACAGCSAIRAQCANMLPAAQGDKPATCIATCSTYVASRFWLIFRLCRGVTFVLLPFLSPFSTPLYLHPY